MLIYLISCHKLSEYYIRAHIFLYTPSILHESDIFLPGQRCVGWFLFRWGSPRQLWSRGEPWLRICLNYLGTTTTIINWLVTKKVSRSLELEKYFMAIRTLNCNTHSSVIRVSMLPRKVAGQRQKQNYINQLFQKCSFATECDACLPEELACRWGKFLLPGNLRVLGRRTLTTAGNRSALRMQFVEKKATAKSWLRKVNLLSEISQSCKF